MINKISIGICLTLLMCGCSSKYALDNNKMYGKSLEANQILKSYKGYQVNIEFNEVKNKSLFIPYQQLKVKDDELVGAIRNNPNIYKRIGLNSFELKADDKSIKPIQCVRDNEIYSNYPSENLFCKFKKSDFDKQNISSLTLIIGTSIEPKTKNIPLDFYRQECIEENRLNRINIQECINQKTQRFVNSQNYNSTTGEIKETYSINSNSEDDRNFVKIFNSFVTCLQSSNNECSKISY